jgi:beclin 1
VFVLQVLQKIKNEKKEKSADDDLDSRIQTEKQLLRDRIETAKEKKKEIQARRAVIAHDLHDARLMRDALLEKSNNLAHECACLREHHQSLSNETMRVATKLKKYMQINAINDAFYIWYLGPFGTINNFRLGTLPVKAVQWDEINAALGQAVLAVSVVASRANYEFKKYTLVPMGSFPKVCKADDKKSPPLQLHYVSATFNVFPKRNFNAALTGFLTCIYELGEYTKNKDPTLALPYAINLAEGKIHDQVVFWGTDDEAWTRALKYLLTDIKWLVAWCTKHCNNTTGLPLHSKLS